MVVHSSLKQKFMNETSLCDETGYRTSTVQDYILKYKPKADPFFKFLLLHRNSPVSAVSWSPFYVECTIFSSKTIPAANNDWPRDISGPKLLDTTGLETLPAPELLEKSGLKVFGQVRP